MSELCNNKQSLQRDGTSQAQRVLAALLPDYVAVDERSLEDLVAFTQQYATEIRYYNLADSIDGDWVDFFTKTLSDDQRNTPHFSLFIAFLRLFAVAQKDLNTLTKRHLDYYYREVLNLHEKPAVPDQVFMVFELAEQLSSSLVAAGTGLNAKKDATGKLLEYDTDKDLVVNKTKVEQLKAVFVNKPFNATNASGFPVPIPPPAPNVRRMAGTGNDWRIYASPQANSSDGKGGELEGDEKRWRTFGTPKEVDGAADRPEAEVGFAFASPLLFLAEGTRTVTIRLDFAPAPPPPPPPPASSSAAADVFGPMMAAEYASTGHMDIFNTPQSPPPPATPPDIPLNVFFSGEKGWIIPESYSAPYFLPNDQGIVITCTIGKGQKAIVAYNEELLGQPFKTKWPVVKMTLNITSPQWADYFNRLSSKTIFTADISVDVSDVRTILLQNDESVLSADKPFVPFGNRPVPGSTFYVGSNEIFQKQLTKLLLNLTWNGLPETALYPQGFGSYYQNYLPHTEALKRLNRNFKVDAEILNKKIWQNANDPVSNANYNLFTNGNTQSLNDNSTPLSIDTDALALIPRDAEMEPVEEFGSETKRGFLRLRLSATDFGHSIYQNSFAQQAIWITKGITQANLDRTAANANDLPSGDPNVGAKLGLPPDPYTPSIKEISVDYASHQALDMTRHAGLEDEINYNNRIDQFFHVMPFGVAERHPYIVKTTAAIPLMPQFPDEGSLYLGFSNAEPPQTLSVLLKVAEGSENPEYEKQPVKWSYMSNNEWYDFTQLQVLADSTDGLLTSGIVSFDLPKALNAGNTELPSGFYWLKAAVQQQTAAICDLISVQAQAVTATFKDNDNDPDHLRQALPAETIKALVESDAAIEKVTQPYASFGGKIKEQSTDFYVRVSERLRHKQRAITPVDYELLVLAQFPAVYKAKCLNHTKYISPTDISELTPGHVSLVIISNLQNKNAVDPLKPRTSLVTLSKIHDYIKTLNPPCAELHVKNPLFEEILVDFSVKFHTGFDNGFYGKKLNEELKQFLAPWAYQTKDIVFGGRIHKSRILNFVEDLPYVDFVTCFNMDQVIQGLPGEEPVILHNIDEAVTTTSASVLTSAPSHNILVLETEDCGCDDNDILQPTLSIPPPCDDCDHKKEKVADGIGADEIDSTFIIGHSPRNAGVDFWIIQEDFEVQ